MNYIGSITNHLSTFNLVIRKDVMAPIFKGILRVQALDYSCTSSCYIIL